MTLDVRQRRAIFAHPAGWIAKLYEKLTDSLPEGTRWILKSRFEEWSAGHSTAD